MTRAAALATLLALLALAKHCTVPPMQDAVWELCDALQIPRINFGDYAPPSAAVLAQLVLYEVRRARTGGVTLY